MRPPLQSPGNIPGSVALLLLSVLLCSCMTTEEKPPSLADVDVSPSHGPSSKVFVKPKTEEEIKQAYAAYLSNSKIDDSARINALSRLAELEFEASNRMLKEETAQTDNSKTIDYPSYDTQLGKTIVLLNTAIDDYPKAKNNDTLLYQLAKAYDQKGEHTKSADALERLVRQYPNSKLYGEAQFRLGEIAFSQQDYAAAEEAYTEVIIAPENQVFYEKSLFKRGWARFKQHYYTEAIDDFIDVVLYHDFEAYEKQDKIEREQFDEYFRAIGLAFSYLGGAEPLHDYFQDSPDFLYTYHTYAMVSDIYLKQERYTDAVETHKQYIAHYPESDNVPYSHLKIIEIWKQSGFFNKVYEAVEEFYAHYKPDSSYWNNQNENSGINRSIRRSLKEYVILMTGYYHNRYQTSKDETDYIPANRWYRRYLDHYSAYARKDNVYFLYGELLTQHGQHKKALEYYELAAYDNDIIIHKEAAFASIVSTDKSLAANPGNKDMLAKHVSYALIFARTYPDDPRTQQVITHAAEAAFASRDYRSTIELADIMRARAPDSHDVYISGLKAESYFNLGEFEETEAILENMLDTGDIDSEKRKQYQDKLALSIYKQGEAARISDDIPLAIENFARISKVAPGSSISATGLYDAIALNMQYNQWNAAIEQIKSFQKLYPESDLKADVSKKLSVAYLKSDQGIKAAQEFERMSDMGKDASIQMAALWQAAEIYEEKNKPDDAIRAYQEYTRKFRDPYPQYVEAMHKLTSLYEESGAVKDADAWRKKIAKADEKALNNAKSERTRYIASSAYLGLARSEKARFDAVELSLPLASSLRTKKAHMKASVKYFGQASKYKIFDIASEATYAIASVYKDFSEALLNSDRPPELNDEELDQYEILLEDQAFPFEDKAIEFFEINLSHIKKGLYNDWIRKTHAELRLLFPARYDRKPKLDTHFDILH